MSDKMKGEVFAGACWHGGALMNLANPESEETDEIYKTHAVYLVRVEGRTPVPVCLPVAEGVRLGRKIVFRPASILRGSDNSVADAESAQLERRQNDKEEACTLAGSLGFALMRRGSSIYGTRGVDAFLVSESSDDDSTWSQAAKALRVWTHDTRPKQSATPPGCCACGGGG